MSNSFIDIIYALSKVLNFSYSSRFLTRLRYFYSNKMKYFRLQQFDVRESREEC